MYMPAARQTKPQNQHIGAMDCIGERQIHIHKLKPGSMSVSLRDIYVGHLQDYCLHELKDRAGLEKTLEISVHSTSETLQCISSCRLNTATMIVVVTGNTGRLPDPKEGRKPATLEHRSKAIAEKSKNKQAKPAANDFVTYND